jgi:hypothetical protein
MTRIFPWLAVFCLLFFALSCGEDEDPPIENEEEVITLVTLTFLPADGVGETVVYSFSDPDGDGGAAPMISSAGTLLAGKAYTGQVSFAGPAGSIDAEIVEEGTEHQVFYQTTADLTLAYLNDATDQDTDGNPIGMLVDATAGAAGTGDLTVILRHEPTKGFAIDRPDLATGETDVEVTFTVVIQ